MHVVVFEMGIFVLNPQNRSSGVYYVYCYINAQKLLFEMHAIAVAMLPYEKNRVQCANGVALPLARIPTERLND